MSISATGSVAAAPLLLYSPTDLQGMTALVQLDYAQQMTSRASSLADMLRDRASAVTAQETFATNLDARRRGDDPQGLTSLGPSLGDSNLAIGELNAAGVQASATPSYLWLQKSVSTDADGNQVVQWTGSWQSQSLSDAVASGTFQVPAGGAFDAQGSFGTSDWPGAAGGSAAALLLADSGTTPPTACSEVAAGDTTYFCFESNPNIIVSNKQVSDWAGQLVTTAQARAAELDILTRKVQAATDACSEVSKQPNETFSELSARSARVADDEQQRARDEMQVRERLSEDDASQDAHASQPPRTIQLPNP